MGGREMAEEWIGLGLVPVEPSTAPGASTELTALVHNLSAVVDQYLVTVEGLEPGWASVAEPSVSLFPGDKASVQITIHPPEGAPAGPYPFTVRAVSGADPSRSASAEATLAVGAVGGYELSLSPQRVVGRSAQFRLLVANHANSPLSLALEGRDDEGALRYRLDRPTVEVGPGSQAEVAVEVAPARRRLVGQPSSHPFRVVAWPAGQTLTEAEMASAAAELEYRPWLGALPAVPRAPLYLALALIPILALLWWWLQPAIGSPQPTPSPSPTTPAPTKPAATVAIPTTQPAVAPGAAGPPPTVVELLAEPAADGSGIVVTWSTKDAELVQLNGEQLAPNGSKTLDVADNQQFELVAIAPDGQKATRRLSVVLLRPPRIDSFAANPDSVAADGAVTLRWQVSGADRASIDGQEVPVPEGELNVTPEHSRDYVLIAENAVGWVVARTSVTVSGP